MTVQQLIDKLSMMPGHLPVDIQGDYDFGPVAEVVLRTLKRTGNDYVVISY